MYNMSDLRKMTGTPVKRGALVRIKSGPWAGRKGYVRQATNYGTVEVTDCATGRYGWWTTANPTELEYIDLRPNAVLSRRTGGEDEKSETADPVRSA